MLASRFPHPCFGGITSFISTNFPFCKRHWEQIFFVLTLAVTFPCSHSHNPPASKNSITHKSLLMIKRLSSMLQLLMQTLCSNCILSTRVNISRFIYIYINHTLISNKHHPTATWTVPWTSDSVFICLLMFILILTHSIAFSSTGVTILLSLTVFLNMVAETMPATSDAVPLLGKINCCLKVCLFCVLQLSPRYPQSIFCWGPNRM